MQYKTYKITVLSPVHVGDGSVVSPTAEVVHEAGASVILDVEAAIRAFPDFFLKSRDRAPTPGDLLAYLRAERADDLYRVVRPRIEARDIRVQLRDGRGALLLPGSTLKGSLRTAIVRSVAAANPNVTSQAIKKLDARNPKFAARELEKQLRGRSSEAHYDWMRVVAVTDATFPAEDLEVVQVRIRSPREDPRREKDFWLACEAIKAGSQAHVRLGLDTFLTRREHREQLGWPQEVPFTLDWLAKVCRERIEALIQTEIAYFKERSPFPEIVKWLHSLRDQVNAASPTTIFLRLGFGIGWCGTTGEIANPQERLQILSMCQAAKHPISALPPSAYGAQSKVFPKSRRYIRSDMSHPLFGFVRLEPVDNSAWPDRPQAPTRFPMPRPTQVEKTASEVETHASPRFRIEAILAAIRPQDVKGRFDGLLRQIEAMEDGPEKKKGLEGLAKLVQRHVSKKDKAFYQREDVIRCLRWLSEEEST